MDQSSNEFKCSECDCVFKKKWNLSRHITSQHQQGEDTSNVRPFICHHCGKKSSTKYGLGKHLAKCQIQGNSLGSKPIKCLMCDKYKTESRENMLDHYHQEHEIDISIEILKFGSLSEFEEWKQKFEKQNICKYKKSKCNRTKRKTVQYYRCHRDGFFSSRGRNLRQAKVSGTNKINGYCPSKIDITLDNKSGKVTAKILKSHVGHDMDLERIPLSPVDRKAIAEKISQKIPFSEVLNNVRDNDGQSENLDRINLLKRKDLYNIQQLFNLKSEAVSNPSDCVSVDAWVKYTKERCDSVVRYYKKQGKIDKKNPELEENDFLLIIMNNNQLDVLRRYGNDCICVDGTPGLTADDFELNTVMVLDDSRQAFPCLFAFGNRSDMAVSKIIFQIMLDYVGYALKPQIFMCDMGEAFHTGWTLVMGPVQNRLYCTWHVLRDWSKRVEEKIICKERKSSTLDTLRTLLEELDENAFEMMLTKLSENLREDPQMQDFHEYFVMDAKYVENRKYWAYCYREHEGLETNRHLEGMHQTLEHIHLKDREVERLDRSINTLMRMVRDNLFTRLNILSKGKLNIKLNSLRRRHRNTESLKSSVISQENENKWIVSSSEGTEMCTIERTDTDTTCSCDLRCAECDACIHTYYCTCPDSSMIWNMCKHIHFLVQSIKIDEQNELCDASSNSNSGFDSHLFAGSYVNLGLSQNQNRDNDVNFTPTAENTFVIVESVAKAESAEVFDLIASSLRTACNAETDLEKHKKKILDTFQSILCDVQTIEDCQMLEGALKPVSAALAANRELNKRKLGCQRECSFIKKKTPNRCS